MKTALATKEIGLRPAIAPVGVAAPVAPLRGMPGVYSDNLAANSFSFILQEFLELGEAPGVEAAFGFPARGFDAAPDVGEVFYNDSCAWLNAVEDRGGQNVVAIPSEALLTPSEASKMPFSRLRTFGLESTSEAKCSLDNFLHMPVAVKAVVRSNGRPGNPQVDANGLTITGKGDIGQFNNNMKIKLAFAINEVGGRRRVAGSILSILRQLKGYLHSPTRSRHTDKPSIPVDLECVQVIARRTTDRLRTAHSVSLLHSGDCRLHGFASFMYRLDMQVGDEGRQIIFTFTIGKALNRISVASALLPTLTASGIESLSKLANSLMQSLCLFREKLKLRLDGSIHNAIISHITEILQGKEEGQFPCRLKATAPLP